LQSELEDWYPKVRRNENIEQGRRITLAIVGYLFRCFDNDKD